MNGEDACCRCGGSFVARGGSMAGDHFAMGRGKALSDREYWRIAGLADGGISIHEISQRAGRSLTCVRRVNTAERGPQRIDEDTKSTKPGRRSVLSECETRALVRAAVTGDFTAAEPKPKHCCRASVRTVQRLLQSVDFLDYTKMDRTLPLTAAHKQARLEWAEKYILLPDTWACTVFSDEKKFNLDRPNGYKFYWRDLRQPAKTYVRRHSGGGSVMVWGAFSAFGKSQFAVLRGRQYSSDNAYTLSEYATGLSPIRYCENEERDGADPLN